MRRGGGYAAYRRRTQDVDHRKVKPMRLYIFKSETRKALCAFAGDPAGSKLPQSHGPWTATGVVSADRDPPYKFSRSAIEDAIGDEGFQLWRLAKKAEA
jgi:hypothetical protein